MTLAKLSQLAGQITPPALACRGDYSRALRLEAFIIPVPPGEDPPDGASFLGHLELTEQELRAWQGTVATQMQEHLRSG